MTKNLGHMSIRRFGVFVLILVAAATLCVSAQRLYANEYGCASLVCSSNDGCKSSAYACDLCAPDSRCALIIPGAE